MFKPKYSISDQMVITLTEIEQLTVRISQSTIPTEVLSHIRKQCQIALTHFSTQIEGNKLSMEQVSGVVEKNKTFGMVRDEKEVKNYFRLLESIPNLIKKHGKKIDPELILECHSNMLKSIVEKEFLGKFRDVQNAIYEAGTGRLVYLPPEKSDVIPLINDLCVWVNNAKIHPLVLAGIFHNQFVTIHPFVDGNGRSARFISLYLLESLGYDWKEIVPVDRYYADDRKLYYGMLQQGYPHNYYDGRNETDFTKWIEYYVEGIKNILTGTINEADLYKTRNILTNNRQSKIIKYLKENKFITASQYAKRFGISTRMATRDLKQLVTWGNLYVVGRARATKYFRK
jgi:Fic family protein